MTAMRPDWADWEALGFTGHRLFEAHCKQQTNKTQPPMVSQNLSLLFVRTCVRNTGFLSNTSRTAADTLLRLLWHPMGEPHIQRPGNGQRPKQHKSMPASASPAGTV